MNESDSAIEAIIVAFCDACAKNRTVSPAHVAQAAAAAGEEPHSDWRGLLPQVRRAARRLAGAGRIAIYRKGRPVDPDGFKGVYRLGQIRKAPSAIGSDARPLDE